MSFKKVGPLLLAGALAIGLAAGVTAQDVDPAIAAMSPEEKVAARQDAMKEDGGLLRSAGNLSGAEAVAAADKLLENYINLPAMFTEDSLVGNTKALPVIFERFDDFKAIFDKGAVAAAQMKAAAEAGDAAAYGASLQAIGATCGECHQQFRS